MFFNAYCERPKERSDIAHEDEALRWAEAGLRRVADLLGGNGLLRKPVFEQRYPALSSTVFSFKVGSWLAQWGEHLCGKVPTGLRDAATARVADVTVQAVRTLCRPEPVKIMKLRCRTIYRVLLAEEFEMPRTFQRDAAAQAQLLSGERTTSHAHIFGHYPNDSATCGGPDYRDGLRNVYRKIRHSALPDTYAEVRYKIVNSGFLIGRAKAAGNADCCSCHVHETVDHVFRTCPYCAKGLWKLVLKAWCRVTGERRCSPDDARVTLLGDRSGGWLDESEESQFAAIEEPFAVVHAATVMTIWDERDRAVQTGKRKPLRHLFSEVQTHVQQLLTARWRGVVSRGSTRRLSMCRGKWVATGMAVERGSRTPRLTLFMRGAARWKHMAGVASATRVHGHALPEEAIPPVLTAIYSDGSSAPDGCGGKTAAAAIVVVHPSDGDCDVDGIAIDQRVETLGSATNNVAELAAFRMACEWAIEHAPSEEGIARGEAAVVRYDSVYAANMATDVWQPKKNVHLVRLLQGRFNTALKA